MSRGRAVSLCWSRPYRLYEVPTCSITTRRFRCNGINLFTIHGSRRATTRNITELPLRVDAGYKKACDQDEISYLWQ